MGKIALAKIEPEKLAGVFEAMRTEGISIADAEKRFDLAPHDRVGHRLAKHWRFPATLAIPIEQHHAIHRIEIRERLAPNLRSITEVVCAADFISQRCAKTFGADTCGEDGEPETDELFDRNGFADCADYGAVRQDAPRARALARVPAAARERDSGAGSRGVTDRRVASRRRQSPAPCRGSTTVKHAPRVGLRR